MAHRHRMEIVLVAAIVVLVALYVRWDFRPFYYVEQVDIFEEKYGVDAGDPGKWFSAWSVGDGQAYALIALDPGGLTMAADIEEAGYRFARVGYGWATWAVSLGQARLVPYALAVVGGLALVGSFVIATRLRARLGARSWLIVANPALFIGFAADTSEPLGILFLGATLASGPWLAAGLLGMTRPTFLLALWEHWRPLSAGIVAVVALAVYGTIAFGVEAMIPHGGRLGLPFTGYVEHVSIWGVLLAVWAAVTIGVGVSRRDGAWVLAGLFILCLGSDVLREPANAWRASGFLPVMWAFGPGYRVGLATERESEAMSSVDA